MTEKPIIIDFTDGHLDKDVLYESLTRINVRLHQKYGLQPEVVIQDPRFVAGLLCCLTRLLRAPTTPAFLTDPYVCRMFADAASLVLDNHDLDDGDFTAKDDGDFTAKKVIVEPGEPGEAH
jgi:hypothetical protein